MVDLFLAPFRIWLFSGLDMAPWQKVDLATLCTTQGLFSATFVEIDNIFQTL